MTNPFDRPAKQGTVRGVAVAALPPSWGQVRRMLEAERDDNARLVCMAETVRDNVTTSAGEPLDVDALPVNLIAELYAFAIGGPAEPSADFTPPASSASGGPA